MRSACPAKIPRVATAIISDLHLGTVSGADLVRRPEPLAQLLEVIGEADRVVFLGDLLELRERPANAVLEDVAPELTRIGTATAGKQVVLVPGNHDYQLVAPAIERARVTGTGPPPIAREYPALAGDLADRIGALMPDAQLSVSYPGIWLRDDVYATHGHYLDVHMTVPRVESLIAATVRRYGTRVGHQGPSAPEHYEAILAPIYAVAHTLAQNARAHPHLRRNNLSRDIWRAANGHSGTGRLRQLLVGRAAIPGAVAAINAAGLGPFGADISGAELRRAGLQAIGEVVDRLEIDADYVIFGHTHRAGPLDGEGAEWRSARGVRLVNSGSWIYEDVFVDGDGPTNPYWPGRVAWLEDSGPPELRSTLTGPL
jgi:predicted phosphodiesterase